MKIRNGMQKSHRLVGRKPLQSLANIPIIVLCVQERGPFCFSCLCPWFVGAATAPRAMPPSAARLRGFPVSPRAR